MFSITETKKVTYVTLLFPLPTLWTVGIEEQYNVESWAEYQSPIHFTLSIILRFILIVSDQSDSRLHYCGCIIPLFQSCRNCLHYELFHLWWHGVRRHRKGNSMLDSSKTIKREVLPCTFFVVMCPIFCLAWAGVSNFLCEYRLQRAMWKPITKSDEIYKKF